MAVELEGCCRVARPTRAHRLVAIAISVWTLPLVAATLTWNGSVSGAWSTAANWTPNAVPTDFDIPVFPSGASNLSNTNDLPAGTTFHQIIFNATGYTVSGNDFSVLTSITALQNAGVVTISAPFTLVNNLSLSGDFLISGNINLQSSFLTLSQGSITVDGVISGTGDVIVNALAVKFNGNNTYSGSTNLNSPVGAIFEVNGSQPASVVKKLGGSTLGGTGTTGPVLATFGTLAPGPLIPAAAIGMLTTGNEQMSSNTLFDFQIGGTIPGTGYDQLRVLGSLDLNGATFKASSIRIVNNFVPIPGQTFVIFDNDGTDPVTPAQSDGALITPTGSPYTFRISFHGGDGN
ncbi:MAG: hypothetical protein ACXW3E_11720, partial [Thermoanaerobaculia bacterium]